MKVFALLPLFLVISCQESLGRRSLIDDTIGDPATTDGAINTNPAVPVPSKLHARCQSASRCFFARMPIYQQNDSGLESYIGNRIGISNYQDPGLCAPTAAAMVLRAVVDERDTRTRLNNSFLENLSSRSWYEGVYQIGSDSYTDFYDGGTDPYSIYTSFGRYFQKTVAQKGLSLKWENSWSLSPNVTNLDIINSIKSKKPGIYIGVDALQRKEAFINGSKKIWYEFYGGGHALVIKGFDGDRLHIQDPWGMDYFARLQSESFAITSQETPQAKSVLIGLTNSPNSFMGYYGSNRKIVLDTMFSLGLD